MMVVFVPCSGVDRTPHTCMVQAAGDAFRIGALEPQSPQLHQHLQKPVFLDARARQTTELARKLALRPSQWRRKNTLIQSDIGKTT